MLSNVYDHLVTRIILHAAPQQSTSEERNITLEVKEIIFHEINCCKQDEQALFKAKKKKAKKRRHQKHN